MQCKTASPPELRKGWECEGRKGEREERMRIKEYESKWPPAVWLTEGCTHDLSRSPDHGWNWRHEEERSRRGEKEGTKGYHEQTRSWLLIRYSAFLSSPSIDRNSCIRSLNDVACVCLPVCLCQRKNKCNSFAALDLLPCDADWGRRRKREEKGSERRKRQTYM